MRRRKLTRMETLHRAFVRCSEAMAQAYRHSDVSQDDLKAVLGAVHAFYVDRGRSLSVVVKEQR